MFSRIHTHLHFDTDRITYTASVTFTYASEQKKMNEEITDLSLKVVCLLIECIEMLHTSTETRV